MEVNEKILDLSRLEPAEKRKIERFLDTIECELLAEFIRERAEEILDTFIGDLNRVINGDKTVEQLEMNLSELCLEESQVPREPEDEDDEMEGLIDSFFERLSAIVAASSKLDN